jgi:hypothetical protein
MEPPSHLQKTLRFSAIAPLKIFTFADRVAGAGELLETFYFFGPFKTGRFYTGSDAGKLWPHRRSRLGRDYYRIYRAVATYC